MKTRRTLALLLALCLVAGMVPACMAAESQTIHLASTEGAGGAWSHSATVDGSAVKEYDYTWHCDPSQAHDQVKNAPAEYFTGEEPGDEAVYIAHDIFYWPELPAAGFAKVSYDGEQEWVYHYTAEGYEQYIFGTLPVQGNAVPAAMMHSPEEAYQNAVLHITKPGAYTLEGEWHGQIWIDLGDKDDTFADPEAKATVILNGVDVTCTVAPALVFYSAYECDNAWEDRESHSAKADTSDAGANVVIADGTVNNFNGTNIYRMLKTTYKSGQENAAVPVQKKLRKTDAAFYSYVSMNINGGEKGTGVLNVTSGFEGLDSELHLSFNGGSVNIYSQDDGVNVNEDGVSVVAFNGGSVHILAGLGSEGDGVDSNGFLVVNGGTVISMANPRSDSGLDSDCGSYVNGGTVVALGSAMDWAEADDSNDSGAVTMNLRFAGSQSSDEAIIVTDTDGKVVFAYDPDKDEVAGSNIRGYQGAVVSFPALAEGKTYHVYVGGDVIGTETAGVYDASTVTGFSDQARQQSYAGGFEGGRPGGFRPDGQRPEGFPDRGEGRPEGVDPGQRPDGMQGEPPEGMPEPPDGVQGEPPEGWQPGQMPEGQFGQANPGAEASVAFRMEDKVNNFDSVTDAGSSAAPAGEQTGQTTQGFQDVPDDAYYHDPAVWSAEQKIVNGTGGGNFSPLMTCTRAQVLTMLWRAAGAEKAEGANPFTDVAEGSYYYDAALWAHEKGLVEGAAFAPDTPCTRASTVTFMWKYAGSPASEEGTAFTDVPPENEGAVAWALREGVTKGTSGTAFSPGQICTRAQVVTFLYRAFAE